jgi:tetratricopeptide (TPR) repeat protein
MYVTATNRWRYLMLVVLCLAPAGVVRAQTAADSAWDAGDMVTAERLFRERLAADSNDQRALQRMALLLAWGEHYDESLRLYDRLLRLAPENADARIERARVIAWSGDPARAAEELDPVIAERPTYVAALKARAQFLSWAGEYTDAVATYDRIIEITPGDIEARRDQARVLSWGRQYDEAAAIYGDLLAVDPSDMDALLGLGRLLSWSNRLDSAEVVFEAILARDPANMEALRGHARTAAWRGRLLRAETRWRYALAQVPDDVESLVGLAATLRWQGRDAAALAVVDRALALAPNDADGRTQRDWARNAMRPRVGANVTYEADSENNRMFTVRLRSAWRPIPRTELRLETHRREADNLGANRMDQRSIGARVTSWWQLEPGWSIEAGLGVTESHVAGTEPRIALSGAIATPRRYPIRAILSYVRAPVEATAAIIRNDVRFDQVRLGANAKLSQAFDVFADGAWARWEGTEPNRRLSGSVALSWRASHMWRIGMAARAFGFEKDLGDGYFDPDFYGHIEAALRWHGEWGKWLTQLELAPGVEKVRTGGALRGTLRSFGRLGYTVAPGRDVSLSGGFSSSGLRVPSGSSDYRYWTVGLGANWGF